MAKVKRLRRRHRKISDGLDGPCIEPVSNFIIDKPSVILKQSEQDFIYKGLVIDQKRKLVLKLLFRASEN
jgi:hypothetical protein